MAAWLAKPKQRVADSVTIPDAQGLATRHKASPQRAHGMPLSDGSGLLFQRLGRWYRSISGPYPPKVPCTITAHA